MRKLICPDASFTPRELFARMQGAWLEPRIGYMWQDVAALTPTTTGGQSVGLNLDLSNNAVEGPELVGTANSAALWQANTGSHTITQDGDSVDVVCTSTGIAQVILNSSNGLIKNVTPYAYYSISFSVKVAAGSSVNSSFNGAYLSRVEVNTNTSYETHKLIILPTTVNLNFRLTLDTGEHAWVKNISVREILGNHASQATSANRPTYQLDAKSLPYLAHDGTDSLSVSLPAINVRRNLLTYSENFLNAAWVAFQGSVSLENELSPAGTSVYSFSGNTANGAHGVQQGPISTTSDYYTLTAYVKKGVVDWVRIVAANFNSSWFNLATGQAGVIGANITSYSIEPQINGWYKISVTGPGENGATKNVMIRGQTSDSPQTSYIGTNSKDFYLAYASLSIASDIRDYQKITDWTSEQYSSSGSVYFSTPQGMSCLHNQSIGTSYNLPALNTDIYGTVITPARLAPPLEQRLALYMHRLAGLSDADFFWQELATDGMTGQLLADDNDTILLRA